MKKKTTGKSSVHRAPRRASTPKRTILFRRIVIISACVVLVLLAAVVINKQKVSQSVAGASIMRGLFVQSTITLPKIADAATYNIYFREKGENEFSNAVRNIPTTIPTYTISLLKKGTSYEYRVAALDSNGKEFLFTEVLDLPNPQSM